MMLRTVRNAGWSNLSTSHSRSLSANSNAGTDVNSGRISRDSCAGRPCASRISRRSPSPSRKSKFFGRHGLSGRRHVHTARYSGIRAGRDQAFSGRKSAIFGANGLQAGTRNHGSVSDGHRVKPAHGVHQITAGGVDAPPATVITSFTNLPILEQCAAQCAGQQAARDRAASRALRRSRRPGSRSSTRSPRRDRCRAARRRNPGRAATASSYTVSIRRLVVQERIRRIDRRGGKRDRRKSCVDVLWLRRQISTAPRARHGQPHTMRRPRQVPGERSSRSRTSSDVELETEIVGRLK